MKFSARILASLSFCHLLNDLMQSLLPSIYPMLKQTFGLSFRQIGLITLVSQITASLLQPVIGVYTDRRPQPHSLAAGMTFTLAGMMLLGFGPSFSAVLAAAALIGLGSAVFHPESSRIARLASGGRHGFAQAFFQVGGNLGSAVGPLLAAFLVLPVRTSGLSRGFRWRRWWEYCSSGMLAIGTSRPACSIRPQARHRSSARR